MVGCLLTDISTIQSFLHDIIDPSAVQEMYYIQESKTTDTSAMKQMYFVNVHACGVFGWYIPSSACNYLHYGIELIVS